MARRIGVRAQFGDAVAMHLTDVVPNWDPTPNLLPRWFQAATDGTTRLQRTFQAATGSGQ